MKPEKQECRLRDRHPAYCSQCGKANDTQLLLEIAQSLEHWATESARSGFSTHQFQPQLKLSNRIWSHLRKKQHSETKHYETMLLSKTERGFEVVEMEKHPPHGELSRLVQQSSAIGDYDDAMERPGASYLWIGSDHRLDREQVTELVAILTRWLATGRLSEDE